MKTEHYCNKYNYICSIARILEEKECFEVDKKEVENKVFSKACGHEFNLKNDDVYLNAPLNGLFKKDEQKLEFIMAIEQEFNVELDDNELAKCLTISDLIDLVVRSL